MVPMPPYDPRYMDWPMPSGPAPASTDNVIRWQVTDGQELTMDQHQYAPHAAVTQRQNLPGQHFFKHDICLMVM